MRPCNARRFPFSTTICHAGEFSSSPNESSTSTVEVELSFGDEENSPAWQMVVENGNRLALHGRIDRVDLWRENGSEEALCVVVDYNTKPKGPDPLVVE